MGIIVLLIVIFFVCFYFLAVEGIRQDQKLEVKRKREQSVRPSESEKVRNEQSNCEKINVDVKSIRPATNLSAARIGRTGIPSTYTKKRSNLNKLPTSSNEEAPVQIQQIVPRFAKDETANTEKKSVDIATRSKATALSLNTGIKELDGPGMFNRLMGPGPNANAVYLLYSEKHNAYKVGYCKATGIKGRIQQVKIEVPDVKLDGTAVFASSQNAFNAEQKVLAKYKGYKYSGVHGRWSGSTEWLTTRPTGKPYFTKPSAVELNYEKELLSESERPIEADIYTVYLMKSVSKGMHKVSWCKSENINKKLKTAQREFSLDVKIVSRFPIQSLPKARAIAQKINEDAGTFKKEGRKETYEWTTNNSYLYQFKSWGNDGIQIK